MKGLGGKAALRSIWERKPVPSTVSAFPQEYSPYSTEHHPSTAVFYVDVVVTFNASSCISRLLLGYIDLERHTGGLHLAIETKVGAERKKHIGFIGSLFKDDQSTLQRLQSHVDFINGALSSCVDGLACPHSLASERVVSFTDTEMWKEFFLSFLVMPHGVTGSQPTHTNTRAHLSRVDTAHAHAHAHTDHRPATD